MSNLVFSIISSQNLYGTMNTGTMKLTNITEKDKEMLMNRHNLFSLNGYELTRDDGSKLFINYLNDNVKSALFNFPQLLYDENNEKIGEVVSISNNSSQDLLNIKNLILRKLLLTKKDFFLYHLFFLLLLFF